MVGHGSDPWLKIGAVGCWKRSTAANFIGSRPAACQAPSRSDRRLLTFSNRGSSRSHRRRPTLSSSDGGSKCSRCTSAQI